MFFTHTKRSFYRSVNTVFGKVDRLALEDVVLHVADSKCMPILLYDVEVCPLSQSDIGSLDFAIFRFLVKLFQTNNKEITNVALFKISNCQVNAYITAKSDLIRYRGTTRTVISSGTLRSVIEYGLPVPVLSV